MAGKNWDEIFNRMEAEFDFYVYPAVTKWKTVHGWRSSYTVFGEPRKISAEEFYGVRYLHSASCSFFPGGFIYRGSKYLKKPHEAS